MKIYLLRHGETAYNVDHRYQGVTDIPLSPVGLAALKQADFSPKTVYVTPLKRTKQTAEILFPTAEYVPVNDLSEMNFGVFEGRNYKEMEHDTAAHGWILTAKAPVPAASAKRISASVFAKHLNHC